MNLLHDRFHLRVARPASCRCPNSLAPRLVCLWGGSNATFDGLTIRHRRRRVENDRVAVNRAGDELVHLQCLPYMSTPPIYLPICSAASTLLPTAPSFPINLCQNR